MTNKQREAFLNKTCDSNIERSAQQMLTELTPKERYQAIWVIRKLHKVVYAGRNLTLSEWLEAVDMISDTKERKRIDKLLKGE